MADFALKALLAGAILCTAACDVAGEDDAPNSITVKLPPARPAVPAPGFAFTEVAEAGDQAGS